VASKKKGIRTNPEYVSPFVLPFNESIKKGFSDVNQLRAQRDQEALTKAEYMRLTFGNQWSNDASAARAYNKITRKETSGARLKQQTNLVGPSGAHTLYYTDENGNITNRVELPRNLAEPTRRRRSGATQTGYWKVNVTFIFPDANGYPDLSPEMVAAYTRSFVVFSSEHTDYGNKQYVEEMLQDVIEYKVIDWQAGIDYDNGIPDGWINYAVEVFPIETTTLALGPTDRYDTAIHHNREVVVLEDLVV
jgi:hypothetical protein